jgi:murein DD-endopeptidase MepM/ murein hydrolase activator NlpD
VSVYDDQNKDHHKELNSLSPQEISELEEKYSNTEDNSEILPHKSKSRDERIKSQVSDEDEENQLNSKIKDTFNQLKNEDRDLYSPNEKKSKGFKGSIKSYGKKKAVWWGVGGAGLGILLTVGGLLGFLNAFKLDHLMQNIESKSFIRYLAASENRSDKWVKAYVQLRLLEFEGNGGDNPLFRANKVDTNHPIRDWYSTMRTSKFEADLAKRGIRFTNEDAVGGRKFVVLKIDGEKIAGMDASDFRDGKVDAMLRTGTIDADILNKIDIDRPGGSKLARAEIKKVVNDNTHWWQVMKRRHVRKDIQNMTGIREWRFFEKTRDNIDTAKINVRNKIIIKALPESTKSGKFIQCMFGITDCKNTSTDPSHPENRTTVIAAGANCEGSNDPQCKVELGSDSDNDGKIDTATNPLSAQDGLSSGIGSGTDELTGSLQVKLVREILSKISGPASIVSIVNTLYKIDENVQGNSLVNLVYMARATQAIGMFTTYGIARDQLKTGEVTGPEVGEFMNTVNAVSNSEGWTNVIGSGKSAVKAESDFRVAKNRTEYCSEEHQTAMLLPENKKAAEREFHYLCESEKIGSANTAKTIQDGWNNTIGTILKPFFEAYEKTGLANLVGWAEGLIDATIGKLLSGLMSTLLTTLGLQDNVEDLMGWLIAKAASILGAGPALSGQEPSGVFFNHILMGGSATNSASMRYQGAAKTTQETKTASIQLVGSYESEKSKNQSVYDRYFAISNPDSAISATSYTIASALTSNSKFITMFGSYFSNVGSIFSNKSTAATSVYAADDFAGVETYDFPAQCINLDPLKTTTTNVSNIQSVLGSSKVPTSELTWELLTNKESWYDYVYSKTEDDTLGKKIYNCALLDTSIRGGLGAIYGYTKDGGLDSSAPATPDDSSITVSGEWTWPVKLPVNISSCFAEPLSKGLHPGLDISVSYVPAYAVSDGTVYGTPGGSYGILIIKHADGLYSVYEHMSKITVTSGQQVKAGDTIGTTGNTAPPGGSSGPHLHFGMTTSPDAFEYADMGSGKIKNPLIYINNGKDYGGCSINPRSY